MQPYFLLHVPYFQLISSANVLYLHGDIKFTKGGWLNRNRVIVDSEIRMLTIPLAHSSDFSPIREKVISDEFEPNKLLRIITQGYKKAPNFEEAFPIIEEIIFFNGRLFIDFVENSILKIMKYFHISTPVKRMSEIGVFENLKRTIW